MHFIRRGLRMYGSVPPAAGVRGSGCKVAGILRIICSLIRLSILT